MAYAVLFFAQCDDVPALDGVVSFGGKSGGEVVGECESGFVGEEESGGAGGNGTCLGGFNVQRGIFTRDKAHGSSVGMWEKIHGVMM